MKKSFTRFRWIILFFIISSFGNSIAADKTINEQVKNSVANEKSVTTNKQEKTTSIDDNKVNNVKGENGFSEWKELLRPDMLAQGASPELVDEIIASLTFIPKVIKLDRHQPEKRMSHEEYLTKVIPPSKVKKARKEYALNIDELKRAEDSTGVPAKYIVALWGKETHFGKITGNYSVPSSLATLAYEGRRASFFRRELMAAVKILAEGHISLANMKGSWAGAMGNCQFMPTSFLQFAVDANNDGKKDIWSDKADIFASMGNYLSRYGWDKSKSWGRQVKLTNEFKQYPLGKKNKKRLSQWSDIGVTRMDGTDLPTVELDAYMIAPGGKEGRIYLVYPNFDIIMKWNRSHYFATGVGYLADRIAFPPVKIEK